MSNIARLILFFSLGFSVSLTLYAGKNNNSFLLIGLFVAWVLSAFIGIFFAGSRNKFSSVTAMLISLAGLLAYIVALSFTGPKRTAFFLFTPLITWIIIAISFAVTRRKNNA